MFDQRIVSARAWMFVFSLMAGWSPAVGVASDEDPSLLRGPYLQLATPESMVVVWRTDGETKPVVKIGASPETLDREIGWSATTLRVSVDVKAGKDVARLYKEPQEDAAKRDPRDHDPSTALGTYQYEARVEGLKPATRYYYAVYDGDRRLAGGDNEHYFVTSPVQGSDTDLRIWVVGDSGNGGRDQREVFLAMKEFTQETRRALDLYLHVGDMAYGDGTDPEFQRNFFDVYQSTLRNTVCWPSMGNHEGHTSRGMSEFGPYYDAYVVPTSAEAGGLPSGTEAYYSYDIANVHFVCLDSHDLDRTTNGAMAQWLIADLEAAQGEWLIAFWHHPPYTKGSHDSDREGQLIEMRTHIMPILESCGVDIVLSGHSHIYERSMLIDGAYATPTVAEGVVVDDGDGHPEGDGAYRKSHGLNPHEGTIAIVSGHGGAGLSRRGTMPIMREIIVEHGSVILDIQGDTLTGTMVNKNTVERDLFSIVKRGQVEVAHLDHPWQPEHDLSKITDFRVEWSNETLGQMPKKWQVVHGAEGSMIVEHRPNAKRKMAVVKAADTTYMALYDNLRNVLSEFQTWVKIPADSSTPIGLVFGYEDEKNYYAFRLNAKAGLAEFVRSIDGKEKVLTQRKVELDFEKLVRIRVEPQGKILEVNLQDKLEYTINLKEPIPEGQLGFSVGAHGSAEFAGFAIEWGLPE